MRLHLWLETEDGQIFGLGRAQLLAKIAAYGSLKKAAEDLGMSYRAAWGKIKKTENVIGSKLIVRSGPRRDGYELTDLGKALLEAFDVWYGEVERMALERARTLFPWPIEGFGRDPERSSEPGTTEVDSG
ncbi:molybdate transport system regulatory protein [Desulfacinum infernum DSM 9756]|uniref:Molybdate transport system regulatory protein n=1 Tax=Desulfacinum infernum DSM 9756 TaxID=1121391 RepID=A0A1M4Y048_9BACT|nr:LysR family transcriptional regulator [Desulfacinum infernum]SHE98943.1 molybdate transport system regulatory protein [Desulfacinum infernum DSM 9756]